MASSADAIVPKSNPKKSERSCTFCGEPHFVANCKKFGALSYENRLNHVRSKALCFNCLKGSHTSRDCRSGVKCGVEGCTGTLHHTLLHRSSVKLPTNKSSEGNAVSETCSAVRSSLSSVQSVFLNVVPLNVICGEIEMATYAFLDQGSTTTLCERSLANLLQVHGTPIRLNVDTLTSSKTLDTISFALDVEPLDRSGDPIHIADVVAVDKIPIQPNNTLDPTLLKKSNVVKETQLLKKHKYLRDFEMPRIENGTVQLLIGANVPEAFRVEVMRSGSPGCPDVIRSPLGWSLFGPTFGLTSSKNVSCNFLSAQSEEMETLHAMYLRDEIDYSPVTADEEIESLDVIKCLSAEDRRTFELMKDSVTMVNGHNELPLPWRHDYQLLPDNKIMATKRLNSLKKHLSLDPKLKARYVEQMQIILQKGYAEEVPKEEIESNRRIWYIPHHPVFNPKKPEKLRIVYDCAASYSGVSLNQVLMQGPDLVNSIVGVLTRFRREKIAIVADVEAMFYQVRVSQRDRDCLRFLWWPEGDMSKQPVPFRMCVHLFGATSSPSCAAFSLRQAALELGSNFDPRVATTIEKNFYVDDLLCTAPTADDGIRLIKGLQILLAKAGFHLTKWLSNSQEVIDSVPEKERSKSLQVSSLSGELHERVLGVNWNVQSDRFEFNISIPIKPQTRRGILSTMNSLFDPLGFVNPVVLEARMIYRVLCQQELEWDEPILDPELKRWERWLSSLVQLRDVTIPRCLGVQTPGNIGNCQMHCFSDASKQAFGMTCYLRVQENDGTIRCTLLMSKSRLAPKSEESVPRLELMAAVEAVKMEIVLKNELGLPLHPSIFWSDSAIVLQSLQNDHKRFPLFVSRRLAFISKNTCVENWKHVPTKQNPADFVSRGAAADMLVKSNSWFAGPPFLQQSPEFWPSRFEAKTMEPQDTRLFDKQPERSFAIQDQ